MFISVPVVDATAVSLLEAMATGTAIIVSSLPSAREWIEDGVSGLVVPPRDEAALAAAMLRFGADPGLRRACGEAALAVARRDAGFDSNMGAVDAIFRHCLDPGQPAPASFALTTLAAAAGGRR